MLDLENKKKVGFELAVTANRQKEKIPFAQANVTVVIENNIKIQGPGKFQIF